MDLRRQLNVVRHWLWLIVLSVVLAAGAAYVVSSWLPKMYEGRTTLIVGQSLSSVNPNINDILASQRLSQTFAQLATTTPLLTQVIDQLGLPLRADELRGSVVASARADSTLLTVTATYGDSQTAASIANAIAEQLIAASPAVQGESDYAAFVQQQLTATQQQIESVQAELQSLLGLSTRTVEQEQQVDSLQGRLVTLRQTYAQLLGTSSGSASNLLSVVDPAEPALTPSSPRVLLNTLLAALLGLLIALGLAYLFDYLDDTVKSPDDVNETAGLSTLGVISHVKRDKKQSERQMLATLVAPRSPVAEAFRTLRTNLDFASVDKPLRTLLVTSAVPGEGKSTVSANIAVAFAQGGKRVILLDADMRRPTQHRFFDLPNTQGLTTMLRSEDTDLSTVAHQLEEPNLRLIATGPLPPNPAELLGSQRMRDLIARLAGDADLVVIDSPPLHAVTDAAVLAAEVDGTLLVVHAGRTKRGAVRQAAEALERVGAHVVGATINQLTARSSAGYYYRYYGEYYAQSETASPADQAIKPAKSTESTRP